MSGHAVNRTSPKGTPFLGTCFKCGKRGLTIAAAMSEECENVRGLSQEEALLEAIDPPPARKRIRTKGGTRATVRKGQNGGK